MKVQIVNDVIVAFGKELFGDDVFDAPDDYTFESYSYEPKNAGEYDSEGFVKIESDLQEE